MSITTRSGGPETLLTSCHGPVHHFGDDGYDAACASWNLAWQQRPAVVVRAATEADVAKAVAHAVANGMSVAVQNTGHGVVRPADEGTVLIVMKDLDSVRVDPAARTATLGGGATWAPVLAAAQEHGLAPLLGSAPHVGAVGYSLGGGFGWLARRHGLAVDTIRALRVALTDGRVVTASPHEEPELFWALCGTAGSSLGVVVEMTIGLAPVTEVYAGNLFYPLGAADEVFERYLDWCERAPAELTSAFTSMAFPPLDIVPEPLRGQVFAIVRGCYAGAPGDAAGAGLVDEWRGWREPIMDTWGPMPFARCAEISMDPVDPLPAASSGRWLARADATVAQAMLQAVVGGDAPSPMLLAEIRHGGAAVNRPNTAVSFGGRSGQWVMELVGLVGAPEAAADLSRRFDAAWERLGPLLAPVPGYPNFEEGEGRVAMTRHSFDAATLQRLAAAKRHYDPSDVFRHGLQLG
ncbi:FAD-binding oxidoreductase [Tessaracoccus lubricantis]|uniref:FAD-binding oxidoreductase n=1 Tax=Tessaracoccus lubricantis TaxID=545543 RepID=A0ABP9FLQ8_9ACTN